jgi:soluble lytic murein transglycosylase
MFAYARDNPGSEREAQALWMAGWSAYLTEARSDTKSGAESVSARESMSISESDSALVAMRSFDQLIASHPDSEYRDVAEYWLARLEERSGLRESAIEAYRALARRAPLGYYGLLAEARLESLGETGALDLLAPVLPPSTIEHVIALLGPDRPRGVDRAIALFRARLRAEAVEELLALADHYRTTGDTLGATIVVDLFRMFAMDAWAFLIARNITGEGGERLDDPPNFWRVWSYAYPTRFDEEVERAAADHKVDPFLVYSVIRTESLFRPDAVSPVGARGLMQIMPATARWIGRKAPRAQGHARRYRAPDSNIWLGAWYVRNLMERYGGNVVLALGAYNAGPSAVDRWVRDFGTLDMDAFVERVPYDETRRYMRRAAESYMVYRKLYDHGAMVLSARSFRPSRVESATF